MSMSRKISIHFARLHHIGNLPIMTICKNKHESRIKSNEMLKIVFKEIFEKYEFNAQEKRQVIGPPNKKTKWTAVRERNVIFGFNGPWF